ncbi:MAG: leucine-rich repeat domain-containing protein, partial [Clostridia bacterium]|nr:leucine-rich repeat domain-containing protein [Clostridia bacterium]
MGLIANAKISDTDSSMNWSDKFGAYKMTSGVYKIGTIDADGAMSCSSADIKTFILPAHVTSVGGVGGMYYIEKIEVEEGNTVYHVDGNCLIETEQKTIVGGCKTSVIPTDGSVTAIGGGAFRGCSWLTAITIPSNITSIGEYAFYGTRLESIVIPESVTQLGKRAFSRCSIKSANIPSGITEIPDYLFENCENNLTTVTLHDNITYIGQNAFWACHNLTDFTLPAKVKYIGEQAFGSCTSLKNITIPDSVEFIGRDAFKNTGYYQNESNWDNGVLYCGKYLLNTKTTLTGEVTVKSGTVSIAEYAFVWSSVEKVILPESVKFLAPHAFYYNYAKSASVTFTDCEGWVSYNNIDKENPTAVPAEDLKSGTYDNGYNYLE